jgi:ubiquinol-cytochrome c reductase iron-sulfur subunit
VDISKLAPGQMMTVEWRGKPVWIINRTKEMLDSLKKTEGEVSDPQPTSRCSRSTPRTKPAPSSRKSWWRSASAPTWAARRPTSSRPVPSLRCRRLAGRLPVPCHGSTFDMAGRVFKNKPAPDNLSAATVCLSDAKILIGEDGKA